MRLSNLKQPSKKLVYSLLVTLLACYVITSGVFIVEGSNLTKYDLITFGSKSCPHCRALHDFFSNNYKDRYYFFWIEDSNGRDLFYKLYVIEVNHGLSESYAKAVPQTLVFVNGTPVAVVIGEVTNAEFWSKFLSSNTTDVVVVYFGEVRLDAEIPLNAFTNFLLDLEKTLSQPTQAYPNINLTGLSLIIIGVAVLVLYFVKRKIS